MLLNKAQKYKKLIFSLFVLLSFVFITGCKTTKQNKCPETEATITKTISDAKAGISNAQIIFAGWYKNGLCLTKDLDEAKIWYLKAADSGNIEAQLALADFFRYELNDIHNALFWYKKAAEEGNYEAQHKLAKLYQNRWNDIDNAFLWYKSSAENGYIQSQKDLAKLYRFKLNDIDSAIIWYKKAAENGDNNSARDLGELYSNNRTEVNQNIEESIKWYSMAAMRGDIPSSVRAFALIGEDSPHLVEALERNSCVVERNGANENSNYYPALTIDKNYPDDWPKLGIIANIEKKVQGKYYCKSLQNYLLKNKYISSCTSLEIYQANSNDLGVRVFESEKEIHNEILKKNYDFVVKNNWIVIGGANRKTQFDESGLWVKNTTLDITMTTNDCLLVREKSS